MPLSKSHRERPSQEEGSKRVQLHPQGAHWRAVPSALERSFLDRFKPTLYVPGCPPYPLTFVCGVLHLLGIKS